MKEGSFYQAGKEPGQVQCLLCPHRCVISPGHRGKCGVRQNQDGILRSLVYGKAVACHADPIEKKPLFHFLPGSLSLSVATVGCNLFCLFCQNSDIAQDVKRSARIYGTDLPPEEIVRRAKQEQCRSVSYTYTEPTVFFEYACDTAIPARKAGLANIFVTNGFIEAEPLKTITPYLDAANVDLKSFRNDYYRTVCGGRLQPVLDTLISMKKSGVWVEVTTLLIPGRNDRPEELKDIALFIRDSLSPDTPWHISRFFPQYKMSDGTPTPPETLRRAREIGLENGLQFVYTGNLSPEDASEDTACPDCGKTLIGRIGFRVTERNLKGGNCAFCGRNIPGRFED